MMGKFRANAQANYLRAVYYFGRHGVNDNNRERQGLLSFGDMYRPRD